MEIEPLSKLDRLKLPLFFDLQRMQQDVNALDLGEFIEYSVIPLRSPAHLVDTSLPFPPPAEDYADGTWTDWLDTEVMYKTPYLKEVVDSFRQHCTVNLVRLLRLEAGSTVKEHTDPTLGVQIERSMIRLTIPIFSSPEVTFFLNQQEVPMKEGECWYLRLTDPHSITHKGTQERINLTIDVIPNDWVINLLQEAL